MDPIREVCQPIDDIYAGLGLVANPDSGHCNDHSMQILYDLPDGDATSFALDVPESANGWTPDTVTRFSVRLEHWRADCESPEVYFDNVYDAVGPIKERIRLESSALEQAIQDKYPYL